MGEHALLSPSSAEKWINCPASLALEKLAPPEDESDYAKEGTAAHELLEWLLTGETQTALDYVGRTASNGWEIDEDMCQHIQGVADTILSLADGNQMYCEERVDFSDFVETLETEEGAFERSFGTVDVIIFNDTEEEMQIHDLKYGYGTVDVENNAQMLTYAIGAYAAFGLIHSPKRVRLFIHQPRNGGTSEWACDIAALADFTDIIHAASVAVKTCIESDDPALLLQHLKPGKKQCHWCRAKSFCPAFEDANAQVMIEAFQSFGKPEEAAKVAEVVATPRPKKTGVASLGPDPERLGKWMQLTNVMEDFIKSVRGEVERSLLAGEPIPGYKLVEGRAGNRKWASTEDVEAYLKSARIKKEDMYNTVLISPTQAEKVLSKTKPKIWSKVAGMVTRTPGKPSVAPESDKHPALKSGGELFDALG